MYLPFTNIHTHVFNSSCAPDRFLRILPMNFVRRFSGPIKSGIDSKLGRKIIHGLFKVFSLFDSKKRSEVDKYISFLNVGTEASQMEVFEKALKVGSAYDSGVRIVGLTMNMDYMDTVPSKNQISYTTQLEQVKEIKRYYPKNFFPFLGIDPRHKSGKDLLNWTKIYFETGIQVEVIVQTATGGQEKQKVTYPYFCGIKLYPALGFFPFDSKLRELYSYAEQNDIPVITHCTRVGSQYIGEKIESLISLQPEIIMPAENVADEVKKRAAEAKQSIQERIKGFYDKGWIKNSKIGNNDNACDLFGHPENYVPLMECFPKLKICLAHLGGSNEIKESTSQKQSEIRKVDGMNWFQKIWNMMKLYPNLYTDISYTLSALDDNIVLQRIISLLEDADNNQQPLSGRVLFGTDFFMTEQEKKESELYKLSKEKLGKWFDKMSRENSQQYLRQPIQ